MNTIRRILVAVKDPTSGSQRAVAKAAQLARALGAKLHLFHAITVPLYADLYSDVDRKDLERRTQAAVCRRLEVIAAKVGGGAVSAEWDFPAYEAVLRQADRIKADLVVAERHAGRHFVPWLLHLNDWELLRSCPMPVLLVKTSGAYKHPVVLAAVDPTHFAKPLKLDDAILQIGSTVAAALRGTLHVVHAHPSVRSGIKATDAFDRKTAERINSKFATAAKADLDLLLRPRKIARNRRHLESGEPVDAIDAVARAVRSDIVVMGALSRSGLKRVLIGNTAESLLDRLSCDLLIVKPPRFAGRVPSARRGARVISLVPVVH